MTDKAHPMHGGVDPGKLKAVSKCALNNVQCGFPDCVGRLCYEDRPSMMTQSDAGAVNAVAAKQVRVWYLPIEKPPESCHLFDVSARPSSASLYGAAVRVLGPPIPAPAPYVAPGRVLVEIVDTGDYIPRLVIARRDKDDASQPVPVFAIHRAPPVAPDVEKAAAMADERLRSATGLANDRGQEIYDAHDYLAKLLTSRAPRCEPLPDLDGVISQIDNMLTGMVPASPLTPHGEKLAALKDAVVETSLQAHVEAVAVHGPGYADRRWRAHSDACDALRAAMAPVDPVAELREALLDLKEAERRRTEAMQMESGGRSYPWPASELAIDRMNRAIAAMEGKKS